jgi:hypothetical protein
MDRTSAAAIVDGQPVPAKPMAPIPGSTPAPPAPPAPRLEVERGPNWLFVRVRQCRPGDPEAESLAQRVTSVLDQHFTYRVVLELQDATLPCEKLIEQLQTLDQWIQDHHGVLRLCGLPNAYRRPLHRARLTGRFPLYRDRQEAVWGGPHRCHPR